jgi:hypothetical protein
MSSFLSQQMMCICIYTLQATKQRVNIQCFQSSEKAEDNLLGSHKLYLIFIFTFSFWYIAFLYHFLSFRSRII